MAKSTSKGVPPKAKSPAKKKAQQTKQKATAKKEKTAAGKGLKSSEQKVLDLVFGFKSIGKEDGNRKQVSMQALMGKSTFANALTTLKNKEYLIVTTDTLTITKLGEEHADPDAAKGTKSVTNEDHQENFKKQFKLKGKQIDMMDLLKDGKVHDKKKTVEELGMKINSTFANLLTGLKKKNIIVFDRKTIQMTDEMFPFGRPE